MKSEIKNIFVNYYVIIKNRKTIKKYEDALVYPNLLFLYTLKKSQMKK